VERENLKRNSVLAALFTISVLLLSGCSLNETTLSPEAVQSPSPEASSSVSEEPFIDSAGWDCTPYPDDGFGTCETSTYSGASQGGDPVATAKPYSMFLLVCVEANRKAMLSFISGDSLVDATKYKWNPEQYPSLDYSFDFGTRITADYTIKYPSGSINPERFSLNSNPEFEQSLLSAEILQVWVKDYQGYERELSFVVEGTGDAMSALDAWGFPCSF